MTRFARANGSKADNRKNPEKPTPWSEMQKQLLEKTSNAENEMHRKKAEAQRQSNYDAFIEEKKAADSKKTVWAQFPGVSKAKQKITDKKKLKKNAAKFIKRENPKGGKEQNKRSDEDSDFVEAEQDESDPEDADTFLSANGNESLDSDEEVGKRNSKTPGSLLKINKKTTPLKNNSDSEDKEIKSNGADPSLSESDDEEIVGKISKTPGSLLKIKKTKERKNSLLGEDEDGDDAEMPEETSSKVPEPIIKIKKKKQKKPLLKISTNTNTSTEDAAETTVKNKSKKSKTDQEVGKSPKSDEPLSDEKQQKIIEKKRERRRKQSAKLKLKRKMAKEALALENGNNGEVPEKADDKELASPSSNISKINQKRKQEQGNQKEATFNKKPKRGDTNAERPRKKKGFTELINGREVTIEYFDGFPVKREDAKRLNQLRNEMISKGLPMSEIHRSMKLERRRAEKALTREKKKVCFKCRTSGHVLSECPELGKEQLSESTLIGVCFKCGSTEHAHFECKVVREQKFKYATCFVCKEQGHIASQCKENERGLYPNGGACKECGDVTHFKKDCPQYQAKKSKEEESVAVDTIGNDNPDDEFISEKKKTSPLFTKKVPKVTRYFK